MKVLQLEPIICSGPICNHLNKQDPENLFVFDLIIGAHGITRARLLQL